MLLLALACTAGDDAEPDRPRRRDRDPREDTGTDDTADVSDTADTAEPAPDDSAEDTADDTADDTAEVGTGGSGGPLGSGSGTVGTSSYAYYAPPCVEDAGAVDVVYTMHGSGGTGAQMVQQWQALAGRECFLVVGLDSESGMSWNFQRDVENTGELVDLVDASYDVRRRYLHGYSAGAHWSWVVGLANSDTFAGLGVFAGSIQYAEQYGVWPGGTRGPVPVAVAHGTADTTVPYSEATRAVAELEAAGWEVELYTVSGGSHAYDAASQDAAWALWH